MGSSMISPDADARASSCFIQVSARSMSAPPSCLSNSSNKNAGTQNRSPQKKWPWWPFFGRMSPPFLESPSLLVSDLATDSRTQPAFLRRPRHTDGGELHPRPATFAGLPLVQPLVGHLHHV